MCNFEDFDILYTPDFLDTLAFSEINKKNILTYI